MNNVHYINEAAKAAFALVTAIDQKVVEEDHNDAMNDITREEIDAKLAATEARLETKVTRIEAKLDGVISSLGEFKDEVRTELRAVKADNKTTRWTIIVTVVASVLAGLAVLYTGQANLLAAFQTGIAAHQTQSGK